MTKDQALKLGYCKWTCAAFSDKRKGYPGIQYCEYGKKATGLCRLTEGQIRDRRREYKLSGNKITGRL